MLFGLSRAIGVLASLVWDRALSTKRWSLHVAAGGLLFASLLSKEVALGLLPCMWFWPRLERTGATSQPTLAEETT